MSIGRRYGFIVLALTTVAVSLAPENAHSKTPSLSLPLDCRPQKTCFIQNYVDGDASKEVRDYTCDKASYNGHKGVDFRILSIRAMNKGVDVLASAAGTVKAMRDGMADGLISQKSASSFKGRECGNGLLLDHGDGWETQYCHMRNDSLVVKKGQNIKRGQKLGLVGLSGKTAFPHIHLSVRHNGKVIDPFNGAEPLHGACSRKANKKAVWQKAVVEQFPYVSGQAFKWGFSDRPVAMKALMARGSAPLPQSVKAPALVFYGLVLNLLKGDQLRFILSGPNGLITRRTTKPVNRHKANYLSFAGKKRRNNIWPAGLYKGSLSLLRGGKAVWQKQQTLKLY